MHVSPALHCVGKLERSKVIMVETFITENEFGIGEVRSWASLLDDNCREQAEAISRVPILEGYLALMPDAHFGFGPPVGSALFTRDAVMPYAVGVDIGCGMNAVKTTLTRERLKGHEGKILGKIREAIPSGVPSRGRRGEGHAHSTPTAASDEFFEDYGLPRGAQGNERLETTARLQFGTLGSGNHFVEVCEDSAGVVWLVLHSGSRGIGNQLATTHVRLAQEAMKVPIESKEFAWFHSSQPGFQAYIDDMLWCQNYAYQQRDAMMTALIDAVKAGASVNFAILDAVNCHHNYAEEQEDGLWLTRKGAINASEGMLGVIPGSMGAATYIVKGKGNAESYNTSPHGAGRLLGRNVARKQLSLTEFKEQMVGKTWLDRDAEKLLDEAPFAYKPIETVMADSADLVDTITVLSQFINYKGL